LWFLKLKASLKTHNIYISIETKKAISNDCFFYELLRD
jgi:hypothetical protein